MYITSLVVRGSSLVLFRCLNKRFAHLNVPVQLYRNRKVEMDRICSMQDRKYSYMCVYIHLSKYIQDVPVGKVNILGGHSIGHSKQKSVYVHVSYSERFIAICEPIV
jgi:hypothetical protein